MITLSNSQGLMFAQISSEQTKDATATLGGWFGAQQAGQAKAIVTDTVVACRGVVTHTVGDAVLSSFADAQAAVKAALELQRRLAKSQSPGAAVTIKVRIGVAFGPVRVMAGKVSGDAVTAAGLLLEKAKPGEILVDQAVKDALGSASEVKLAPHGGIENVNAFRVTGGPPPPEFASTTPVRTPPPPPAAEPPPAARPAPKPAAAPAGPLVLKYGETEKRFTPADGEIELGRALENHVPVPVVHVSRKHAKIVWEGQVPYVVNLSQNGTCVKYEGAMRSHMVVDKVRLLGKGQIALAPHFGLSDTNEDVITFSFG
ncbi:MAG: FHA domain-containing protein [Betaproteobacteria bacterium]